MRGANDLEQDGHGTLKGNVGGIEERDRSAVLVAYKTQIGGEARNLGVAKVAPSVKRNILVMNCRLLEKYVSHPSGIPVNVGQHVENAQ